ncbi:MAG: S10 family peptidase [Usitatibacter sp.]
MKRWLSCVAALAIAGCGGGGGGGSSTTTPPPPSTSTFTDPVTYSSLATASLPSAAEIVSVTHHQLALGGTTLNYTATAGHMTALAQGTNAPEASFFYVAYTLDGANAATRPVTFFYNGGPGSATVWLHLGSFGPRRLQTGVPSTAAPSPFPLVDNAESLLDLSDLVFVDAIGTGLSQAIAPNNNRTFWGVDVDAAVFRDFIARYVAVNNRGASPKFLFGESYGTTRSAVLARLLESAGLSLKGVVLQSSVLDYNANCGLFSPPTTSCGDILPTYGAVGAYFNLAPDAAGKSLPDYEAQLKPFAATQYDPAVRAFLAHRDVFVPDPALLAQLVAKTGMALGRWQSNFNMDPTTFHSNLVPGTVLGLYDARMTAQAGTPLAAQGDPSSTFIDPSFAAAITSYLGTDLGYTNPSNYVMLGNAINVWNFSHGGMQLPDVVPDLAAALALNPKLKVLSPNGYHDLVTPFFITENDIARIANPNVSMRVYAGGHMTYLDDAARRLEKADFVQFYQSALAGAAKSIEAPMIAAVPAPATPRAGNAVNPPTVIEVNVRDPWVPPQLAGAVLPKKTRAAALDAQVEEMLRADFEKSATQGALTREAARAAGLGFVAENFDAIDAARRGAVRFEDLKRFLKERGARLPD